jgi:hypothetical protein
MTPDHDQARRRIALLHLWTEICAQVNNEIIKGHSKNFIELSLVGGKASTCFTVLVLDTNHENRFYDRCFATELDAEAKLEGWLKRLKVYAA